MDLGIAGRRAVVTGASAGIGRACAIALADEGAHLLLVARHEEALAAVAEEITDRTGRRPTTLAADVVETETCQRVRSHTSNAVDILVNNVGGTQLSPILEVDEVTIDHLLDTNYRAAVRMCSTLVPLMTGWGRVVNIGSIAAREPHPASAHYSAAKAALTTYGAALARAVGRRGVTVNTVLPGYTLTRQMQTALDTVRAQRDWSETDAVRRLARLDEQPVGRIGRPEDVADAVVFLASERASWITGVALPVDGGALRGTW